MIALVNHTDGLSSFMTPELAHKLHRADLEDGVLLWELRAQVEEELTLLAALGANDRVIVDEPIVLLPLHEGLLDRILLLVDFVDLVKESRDLLSVGEPFQSGVNKVVLQFHGITDRKLLHVLILS